MNLNDEPRRWTDYDGAGIADAVLDYGYADGPADADDPWDAYLHQGS